MSAGLFVPLTHDVLCSYCKSFTPQQWDDREKEVVTGWQFRWCPHELCWQCAAGVVEACPVCAVSGPQGLQLAELETEALRAIPPNPEQHLPLWPWFLLVGTVALVLMFWPQISQLLGL